MEFNEQINDVTENTPEVENENVAAETAEIPVEAAAEASAQQPVNAALNGAKEKLQGLAKDERVAKGIEKVKSVPKKIWLAIGAALVALIVVISAVNAFSNTYKTPLNLVKSFVNEREHKNPVKDISKLLNGLCEDEVNGIIKILKKSENYEDMEESISDTVDGIVESLEEQYGENYKVSYKIDDKEKLDKDDCKDYQDEIKDLAKSFGDELEEFDDYDSDDWSDFADEVGIKRADAKKLVQKMEDLQKELKSAKVSAGYELDLIITIDGSELDEPEETEMTICVYKINGRWFLDVLSLGSLGMFF